MVRVAVGIRPLKLTCKFSLEYKSAFKINKEIKFALLFRPTVTTTLKNLVTLYRKQGKNEAADQLDNCAVKIKRDVIVDLLFYLN